MRERYVAVTLGFVALLRAAPASAQASEHWQKRAALSWQRLSGAEYCPNLKDLAQRVDAHLGHAAFVAPSDAEITIEAAIAKAADHVGWQLTIRMFGASGEALGNRELSLTQANCSEAIDNAALALALMIDPDALTRHSPSYQPEAPPPMAPAGVAPPPPPSPPAAVASAPRPATAPPPPDKHWHPRLSLGFTGSLGQLPSAAVSAAVGVRITAPDRSAGLEVAGRQFLRQRNELRAGVGVDFQANAFELGLFWSALRRTRGHLSFGGGFAAGQLHADAFNLNTRSQSASSWLANALLNAELAWHVNEHWSALLRPELAIPIVRDRFEIGTNEGTSVFFRPTLVGQTTVAVGFSL
jgi:hypothetical protein